MPLMLPIPFLAYGVPTLPAIPQYTPTPPTP